MPSTRSRSQAPAGGSWTSTYASQNSTLMWTGSDSRTDAPYAARATPQLEVSHWRRVGDSTLAESRRSPLLRSVAVPDDVADWWLDERLDGIGLTEEDIPTTVEQWFDR